jgi:hypothetical protein
MKESRAFGAAMGFRSLRNASPNMSIAIQRVRPRIPLPRDGLVGQSQMMDVVECIVSYCIIAPIPNPLLDHPRAQAPDPRVTSTYGLRIANLFGKSARPSQCVRVGSSTAYEVCAPPRVWTAFGEPVGTGGGGPCADGFHAPRGSIPRTGRGRHHTPDQGSQGVLSESQAVCTGKLSESPANRPRGAGVMGAGAIGLLSDHMEEA